MVSSYLELPIRTLRQALEDRSQVRWQSLSFPMIPGFGGAELSAAMSTCSDRPTGRTGVAEAPVHTSWVVQKSPFLGQSGKKGCADPLRRPDMNLQPEDMV